MLTVHLCRCCTGAAAAAAEQPGAGRRGAAQPPQQLQGQEQLRQTAHVGRRRGAGRQQNCRRHQPGHRRVDAVPRLRGEWELPKSTNVSWRMSETAPHLGRQFLLPAGPLAAACNSVNCVPQCLCPVTPSPAFVQGAINAIPAANTAFVHRSTLASIQFYVSWTSASNAQRSTAWLQACAPKDDVLSCIRALHLTGSHGVNMKLRDQPEMSCAKVLVPCVRRTSGRRCGLTWTSPPIRTTLTR